MPGGWAGSTRQLPAHWRRTRAAILQRDGHRCTWLDQGERCTAVANEVDHIADRDDHSPTNLRALCHWHHAKRSSAQGNTARVRLTNRRPTEPHPGIR